jgi:hypothetical protein
VFTAQQYSRKCQARRLFYLAQAPLKIGARETRESEANFFLAASILFDHCANWDSA